ncbi:MAG: RND family transporter [Acutalibacteraceae bacterium]
MKKLSRLIVRLRIPIIILAVILIVPSVFGMMSTRINYDMLTYLPDEIDTVQGQNILLDDFGKGAFSIIMVEDMKPKDVAALRQKIAAADHVESAIWYDSLADLAIPPEVLPEKFYNAFNKDNSTLMAVFFDTSTSADETIEAIENIRSICGSQCFVTGMSALVTDLRDLCEQEEPIYILIAVSLSVVVMMLLMDSWLVPLLFLASIGMSILLNLGTNFFLGEISYITKALAAVLQLAVTMDYSIFLWHSYSEQKKRFEGDRERAMAHAISNTFASVTGSSITTIAGFIALCFMSFTLGLDLGIVMAKGVLIGVIGCLTTLPSMILLLDKVIEKTIHKPLIPSMDKLSKALLKRPLVFIVIFAVVLVPALFGYMNTEKYYDMTEALPQDMNYVISNSKLQETYDMSSTHMILCDAGMKPKDAGKMLDEIGKTDGVKAALGFDSLLGPAVPEEILPDSIRGVLKGDKYQLMVVLSEYKTATDEVNEQVERINNIIKKYDKNAMLIGEAPCTKDLITITARDFEVVSVISVVAIFLIIGFVLKSFSLPFILVAVIEFAIFINLGIPYYTGTKLAFIAPICISTIQLGATVDYAILMTTRYKKERSLGNDKRTAAETALSASIPSILVSALGFFAATFGVGVYSKVDIISSMCMLMARGALISMFSVILILPSMLVLLDRLIVKTGFGFKARDNR